MSGETEANVSAWNPDTLKVLEDEKIRALEKLVEAGFKRIDARHEELIHRIQTTAQTMSVAQDKFEATVERDSVKQNEFRGSLDDLSKGMATRRETEATFGAITARLDDMAKQIGDLRSRIDVGPAALQQLQSRLDVSGGRQQGVTSTQQLLIALAGVLIAFAVYWGAAHRSNTPVPVVVTVPTVTVPASK